MKKKKQKKENNGKEKKKSEKKAVSFLTALFFFCLAGFSVGIYLSHREAPPLPSPPPPTVPSEKLPERVIMEKEKGDPSDGSASLKPEDLTFFNTLLDDPEAEAPPVESPQKEPKKPEAAAKKEVPVPETKTKKATEKPPAVATPSPKPETARETVKSVKTPEPKTAPEEPPKPGGKRYRLQIASFALPSEAEQMRRSLAAKGYADVVIRTVELPNRGTWFRVYVGGYNSLEEAQRAEKQAREKDELPTLVVLEKE